jgi:hypothetical protein
MSLGMTEPTEGGDGSESLEAHSAAVMKALKAGDRRGFTTALKAFVKECYDSEDSGSGF